MCLIVNLNAQQLKKTDGQSFPLTDATIQSIQETGYARCLTDENEILLKQQFPERASSIDFENWLAPKIQQIKANRIAGKSSMVVYNIPVVIHIVHNGDAIGTGENITDAQALSQIQVMNEDFRRLTGTPGGANTTGLAVDVEINFCIAQQDEMGNPTNGVIRHNITPYSNNVADGAGGPDWETRADTETMKASTQWDPTRYLNMWTIRPGGLPLNQGGQQGLLGYAQFPSNSGLSGLNNNGGAANTDGVVAGFDAMGTIAEDDGTFIMNPTYNLGRTMTHEVGHWVGLRHIWGDGDCNADDFCADTPNAGNPNYQCNVVDSCPASAGNDQIQNYMDYTNDACMDTFTQDQKDRIVAVMTNSPRRMELNTSNTCNPAAPTISFTTTAPTSIIEESDCTYNEYTFDFSMTSAGSQASTASFLPTGTATNNDDFELLNNSVTFPAGATTASGNSTVTLRVYKDSFVEADETLILTVNVSTTGNAIATVDTYNLTITNDDTVPVDTQNLELLNSNFEATDSTTWNNIDNDGTAANDWSGFNGLTYTGIDGAFAGSLSNNVLGNGANYSPDNFYYTGPITIPLDASNVNFNYGIGGYLDNEPYEVYWTTTASPTAANITNGTLIDSGNSLLSNGEIKSVDLTNIAGNVGYLAFRHQSQGNGNQATDGVLLLDNITITATVSKTIQTDVNTVTYDQVRIATSGSVYTSDNVTGNLMLDITNNNTDDFGCVDTSVSRAGTGAQSYNGSTTANFVTDKTFTITPTNVVSSTNATVDFYFTSDEITGWEAITGQSRTALSIIRDNGSTTETVMATVAAFGSGFKASGTFFSGIDGVYYFGVANTLSTSNFEFEQFAVFPNPTSGDISIALSTQEDVKISIYDIRGREILNKNYTNTSSIFNRTINMNASATGVYIVKVEAGNKSAYKRVIVK